MRIEDDDIPPLPALPTGPNAEDDNDDDDDAYAPPRMTSAFDKGKGRADQNVPATFQVQAPGPSILYAKPAPAAVRIVSATSEIDLSEARCPTCKKLLNAPPGSEIALNARDEPSAFPSVLLKPPPSALAEPSAPKATATATATATAAVAPAPAAAVVSKVAPGIDAEAAEGGKAKPGRSPYLKVRFDLLIQEEKGGATAG
jgi:hypothetical protein